MEKITLKSGRELSLAVAPFASANKLRKEIVRELRQVKIDTEIASFDIKKIAATELDAKTINTLKDAVCQLLGSDTVESAMMECAGRCLLNGQKINQATFEDAREDYLVVAWEVIKLNVAPFFADLVSQLLPPREATTSAPR